MALLRNQAINILMQAATKTRHLLLSAAVCFPGFAIANDGGLEPPTELGERVGFWEKVFQEYDSKTIVIHDAMDPQIILDILPFSKMAALKNDRLLLTNNGQKNLSEKYQRRYEAALRQFSKMGSEAKNLGPMEDRVYQVYRKHKKAFERLLNGSASLRQQRGMADVFKSAAEKAQDFLPYLEGEFKAIGVPTELTRIAFVESMFNESAISKVGASGMFQFMPGTAQNYMIVNQLIDERNSPIKAARAAAQLFKSNYQSLGNWPLAITAYNHGPAGIARAVKALRSDYLPYLIEKWDGPSFGFASQNFYAEFVAARNSYNKGIRDGSVSIRPSKLKLGSGKLKQPVTINDLAALIKLDSSEILKFNPCINKKVASRYPSMKLPRGFELLLPVELGENKSNSVIAMNGYLPQKKIAFDQRSNPRRGEQ